MTSGASVSSASKASSMTREDRRPKLDVDENCEAVRVRKPAARAREM
jgi:hypothetical protein